MNGRLDAGRLISLTLCCLGTATNCLAISEQEVAAMAEKAARADVTEYVKARDDLVEAARQNLEVVKNAKRLTATWQLDVVYGVAIEHMEKANRIKDLTSRFPQPPQSREESTRIIGQGQALVERAADVPYFLVEQLWKTSAATHYERTASLAYALGKARSSAAREPIEALMTNEYPCVRYFAACALKDIADPKSTPVLFDYMVNGYLSNEFVDRSHAAAGDAFSVCARKDFLPTVKAKLKESEEDPQSEGDGEILKRQRNALRAFLQVTILALEK